MNKIDERVSVFVSYSHKDEDWLDRLSVHLSVLEREYRLDKWDDTRITAGNKWRDDIRVAIEHCDIAILIISADFLASDFIHHNEIPPLLKSCEEEGTIIIPIIASPCLFSKKPELSQFQSINPPSRSLISMSKSEQEETFVKVAERMFDLINEVRSKKSNTDDTVSLPLENFLDQKTSQKLVKIGDWIHDFEQREFIGSGPGSYLLSRRSFGGNFEIRCSIQFSNFSAGKFGQGLGFNAGIVFGWNENGEGHRYYNLLMSGTDILLERVGFNDGFESDYQHISRPVPFHIKSGEFKDLEINVSESTISVSSGSRQLFDLDRPTGVTGRVGLRPWRSQIVCKEFVATEVS